MLWYKSWLETRIRFAITAGLVVASFAFLYTHPLPMTSGGRESIVMKVAPFSVYTIGWVFLLLAGSGITTQPAFRATAGIHGSTLYTLALPVSRLRLVAVRAGLGWMEGAALIAVFWGGIWLFSPALRTAVTGAELLEYCGVMVSCGSVIYFLSVLLATFLDEQWRIWGTMLLCFPLVWLAKRAELPATFDVVRALGKGSPLFGYAMPWGAVALSLAVSAALFFAAVQVARAREY